MHFLKNLGKFVNCKMKLKANTSAVLLLSRGVADEYVISPFQREEVYDSHSDFPDGPVIVPQNHTDFLVVGGGLMGQSLAFSLWRQLENVTYLKARKYMAEQIAIVEKDPTLCTSSTALSAGGIRTQFSVPANIKLSQMTAEFMRNLKTEISTVEHPDPDISFNPQGYLIMATKDGREQLIKNFNTQTSNGAKIMLMTKDQLKETMPWMNVDGIELATYGLKDEGWFDPMLLMDCYKKKNPTLGVQNLKGEVVGFKKERLAGRLDVQQEMIVCKDSGLVEIPDDRIVGAYVKFHEHDKPVLIETSNIINCAGAESGELAEMAGIGANQTNQSNKLNFKLPVERRKRYIYVVHCPDAPLLDCPFIIDPSGAYVRRDGLGGKYICGMSPTNEADEPSTDNLDVDYEWFNEEVWPRIAHRVPAFEKLKLTSAWAGFYDYNTYDQNAVIGNHPYYNNMWFMTGFSGHGVQQSYGAASCLAELMVQQEAKDHDDIFNTFSFNRFINHRPTVEFNII